jgi:seryl-tRNA synthetase
MFDVKLIRNSYDEVKEGLKRRNNPDLLVLLDDVVKLDKEMRELQVQIDKLKKEKNDLTHGVNNLRKEGKDISSVIEKVKELPGRIKIKEEAYARVREKVKDGLKKFPNLIHIEVPEGESDKDNKVLKEWGEKKEFEFVLLNHVELIEKNNWGDFDKSAEVSGNGFYYLKGDLALLNQAIIRFAMEFMQEKDYTYIEGPLMLRKKVLDAAMDTEGFEQSIYSIDGEDLNLIGTSEHSILGLHIGKKFNVDELPKKYFSYSMCFRKEIGSHGINEKGLWRTHQFNKVEQFVFCEPEDSYAFYDQLLENTEELVQELGLPYRVIECCVGDLAIWKHRSADVEVWRPTTKDYGEITSLSNCTDYQARPLGIKFVKNEEKKIVHTLNNTALATSRIMVAILENYQLEDGSVAVPEVLQKFMFGKQFMRRLK